MHTSRKCGAVTHASHLPKDGLIFISTVLYDSILFSYRYIYGLLGSQFRRQYHLSVVLHSVPAEIRERAGHTRSTLLPQ
jgi:hypothetical protein